MKLAKQYTTIGGQAVIEGVMMRSPHFVAVAVRKSDQKILIQNKEFLSVGRKYSFLRKPIIRGVVTLLESMIQGVGALNFSAQVAAEDDSGDPVSHWAMVGSLVVGLAFGLGLFVALPHFLTVLISSHPAFDLSAKSPWFHLLDGFCKILILLAYIYAISRMSDIKRVFQYHGAEHKSIYAFEANEDLTVSNARKHSTLHPRCGTSFILFLVLISIFVFSIVFPFFNLTEISSNRFLNHWIMVLAKMVLMLPVAGLAYEFIKACAFRMDHPLFRLLIWPGLMLQKLTTYEPTDDQLEVALASLRQVLAFEEKRKKAGVGSRNHASAYEKNESSIERPRVYPEVQQIEITKLSDLGAVSVTVGEFLEG